MFAKILIASIVYFLLAGLVQIRGTYYYKGAPEAPEVYQNSVIKKSLFVAAMLWVASSIYLLYLNWKYFLLYFFMSILFGRVTMMKAAERFIITPLYILCVRIGKA